MSTPIFTIGHSTRTLAEFLVPPFSVTEQVPLKGRGLAWPAGTEVTKAAFAPSDIGVFHPSRRTLEGLYAR